VEVEGEGDVRADQEGEEVRVDGATGDAVLKNGESEGGGDEEGAGEQEPEPQPEPVTEPEPEPEWISVIKKHRVQAARLEAMAAGQDRAAQRPAPTDIAVR